MWFHTVCEKAFSSPSQQQKDGHELSLGALDSHS